MSSLGNYICENSGHQIGQATCGLMKRNEELSAVITAFEEASGCRLHGSHATAKRFGEALSLMQWSGLDRWVEEAEERTKEFAVKLAELRKAVPK